MRFSSPAPSHGAALWALARRSGLDENSPYAYLLWGEHFSATSIVAETGGEVAGFITGFRIPDDPDALFVWQIAVDAAHRGCGVAGDMLDALVGRLPWCRAVEATVTPGNAASVALFRAFAARHRGALEEAVAFGAHLFPGGSHEAEVRFRIAPVDNQVAPPDHLSEHSQRT